MKVDVYKSAPSIQTYNQLQRENGDTRTKHSKKEQAEHYTEQDLKTTVESVNGFIEPLDTNLKFVYHEQLNEYYVTLVNPLTNEVIREIPPKKMLDMYAAMTESLGMIIDEKI